MANRMWIPTRTLGRNIRMLYGRFTFSSGSISLDTTAKNWGIDSVADVSTGVFRVNWQRDYPGLRYASLNFIDTNLDDLRLVTHSESQGIYQFMVHTAGTAAAPPDTATVSLVAFVRDKQGVG